MTERHWIVAAALAALAVTVAAIDPMPVGLWVDDGHYVLLARALAEGDGYRYINLPGQPAATHFPPGYPAVLALIGLASPAFPGNVAVFTFANAVFVALAASGMTLLGSRVLGFRMPLAAAAAVTWAAALPTLMLSTVVLSESLFLALLLPALVLAERTARDGGRGRAAMVGALLASCMLVRSIGVAAAVAVALALIHRRRWHELAIVLATAMAAMAPWLAWKRLNETTLPAAVAGMYGDYGGWLRDGFAGHGVALAVRVVARNAADIVESFARYWSLGPEGAARLVVAAALIALTITGAIVAARRAPVAVGTLVAYVAIVVVWPFAPQRFIWGIGPLWVVVCAVGGAYVWQVAAARARPPLARALRFALTAVAVAIPLASLRAIAGREWHHVPRTGWASAAPLLQWLVQHTPADAVVAADNETFLYLYSGRRAVPFVPFKASDRAGLMTAEEAYAGLPEVLDRYDPRWVLAVNLPAVRVASHFTANGGAPLAMIAVPRSGAVFEVVRRAPTPREAGAQ